jgi:cobalt-precorrin 5A hydrolase
MSRHNLPGAAAKTNAGAANAAAKTCTNTSNSNSNSADDPASPEATPPSAVLPRVALIAITKHGAQPAALLARQLPGASLCVAEKFAPLLAGLGNPTLAYSGAFRDAVPPLFAQFDQLVFFVSLGAVVRLIAPQLKSKDQDPGVIVVDEAGQFVIPVLSGHVGGANAFALQIAALLGGKAVLTTASDVGQTIAVDILGRELGWQVQAPKINITRVSAAVVNEESVALVQEAGSPNWWTRPVPLPANIQRFGRFEEVDLTRFKAVLWITDAEVSPAHWAQLHERLVVYRPPQGQGA